MRVLSRNRRGAGSRKNWNALLTLMLEAVVLAGVKASKFAGLGLLWQLGFISWVPCCFSFVGFFFLLVFFGVLCVYFLCT
jgi:hypothetical protein